MADAIAEGRSDARVRKAAEAAAAALWPEGLRAFAEVELARMEDAARHTLELVAAARVELPRPISASWLAIALVEALSIDLVLETESARERLEEIEEELEGAPGDQRRPIALQAAAEIFGAARVPRGERDAAAARVFAMLPPDWDERPELAEDSAQGLARLLATDERHARSERPPAAELTEALRPELPLLTGELEHALARSIPDDAGEDELWIAAVVRSLMADGA